MSRTGWILAAVTTLAIGLRVGFVLWCDGTPGFQWSDPDDYLGQGLQFAAGHTLQSLGYDGFFKAPLHVVFLAAFAADHRYVQDAAIVQAVMAGAATVGVYGIARQISREGLALATASAWAVYYPSVMSLMAVRQEHVYIPLLIAAFALLSRAWRLGTSAWAFAAAGACFGLASLARSMPVYFVTAATIWLAVRGNRALRARIAVAFLAGFLVVAGPYIAWVSAHAGQLVVVENIGSYGLARLSPEGRAYFGDTVPSISHTAAFLGHKFAAAPATFASDLFGALAGTLYVPGGRWLEQQALFATAWQAGLGTIAAHLGDVIYVIAVVLAPFGLVRRGAGGLASLLGLWVTVHLTLTLLSGYGGLRFREPIEFALFALAASALAGGSASLTRWRAAVACVLVVPALVGISKSLVPSLQARATYGVVEWIQRNPGGPAARLRVGAGLPVISSGAFEIELSSDAASGPARIAVWVERHHVGDFDIGPTPRTVTIDSAPRKAFVEIAAAAGAARDQIIVARVTGR